MQGDRLAENCCTSILLEVDQITRPAALDDRGRALGQQFEPDRAAEFARAVGRPGARGLDEQAAASSSTEAVSDICAPSMVEYPAIGELQWPLRTHSTSRSASALWRAAGSSISDRMRRVCQSLTAHSTATMPCPDRRQHFLRPKIHRRCGRARPTRSSPERAMISASAGPTSPPPGSRCISRLSSLRTRVSAAPR